MRSSLGKNIMIEGWHNDTYLILFEEQAEATTMTAQYGLHDLLPGFAVVGLRGWDDLIVRDGCGRLFTVPAVPVSREHLEHYDFDFDLAALEADDQMRGKIKWYVTPLVFGGDSFNAENVTWITIAQHPDAVRWWNAKYNEIKAQQAAPSNGGQRSSLNSVFHPRRG